MNTPSAAESGATSIGGYFELEVPAGAGEYYPEAFRFQSGRAAFLALLQAGKPDRVWMPWFICDSMLEPLRATGVEIVRYCINENLDIDGEIVLEPNAWLLYVNYFGICDGNVDRILKRFPRGQVVIDNSQAFFSQPTDCLATIYSPRKFFGVPDGGYLSTRLAMKEPLDQDVDSFGRSAHLLKRLAFGAEAGYPNFAAAEDSLSNLPPRRMSVLTRRLLHGIDYHVAEKRRQQNFSRIDDLLCERNQMRLGSSVAGTALCYPYLIRDGDRLRQSLLPKRIFIPTYWQDVLAAGCNAPAFETQLARDLLPIPIDQRYSMQDMEALSRYILDAA